MYQSADKYYNGIITKRGSKTAKWILKQVKRTIDKPPATSSYIFEAFINGKEPPERSSWNRDLARWSLKAGTDPKVGPKTPHKTIES